MKGTKQFLREIYDFQGLIKTRAEYTFLAKGGSDNFEVSSICFREEEVVITFKQLYTDAPDYETLVLGIDELSISDFDFETHLQKLKEKLAQERAERAELYKQAVRDERRKLFESLKSEFGE